MQLELGRGAPRPRLRRGAAASPHRKAPGAERNQRQEDDEQIDEVVPVAYKGPAGVGVGAEHTRYRSNRTDSRRDTTQGLAAGVQRWMMGKLPEPMADYIQHQLHREAAQEKDVEAVKYFSEGGRGLVLVQETPVELGLCDGENEILQKQASVSFALCGMLYRFHTIMINVEARNWRGAL